MNITIDFEVRSPVDIKKAGAWAYAEHPDTTPLCLAIKTGNAPAEIWLNPSIVNVHEYWDQLPVLTSHDVFGLLGSAKTVEAHNAGFERAIWRRIMVPRFGWLDIPDHKWRCSAAKAAAHALPRSLEGAGAALKLPIQKDMEGHRIMMKVCRPRKPRKGEDPNGLYWNEDPEDLLKLFQYCLQDVESEHAISLALPDLNPLEQKIWFLDQRMNERGILADVENSGQIIQILKAYETKLLEEVAELTFGEIQSVKQVEKMAEYCAVENMTAACVSAALETDLSSPVRRLLEIRQTLGKSSISKFKAILERTCADNRLRENLVYHGATTGRWTAKGVQLQNLPRKSVDEKYFDLALQLLRALDTDWIENLFSYKNPVEMAQALIRPMLMAEGGKDLYAADFSQIEARTVLWYGGEVEALGIIRNGTDIYCAFGPSIYDREISKADKNERQVCKAAILGLGFGMGGKKFQLTCRTQAGVEIEKKFSRKVVKAYRSKYTGVVQFWYATERAAIEAVQNGGPVENGKTTWKMHGRFLQCILPSGRKLSYPYPVLKIEPCWVYPCIDEEQRETSIQIIGGDRRTADKRAKERAVDEDLRIAGNPIEREKTVLKHMATVKGQWLPETTYGGKIVENIVQGTARDVMAEAMLRLENTGYPLILSVHDEVIAESDHGSLEEFERLTATPPRWADGLPIAVEGWKGKRYRK